jgi:hypothetical protein
MKSLAVVLLLAAFAGAACLLVRQCSRTRHAINMAVQTTADERAEKQRVEDTAIALQRTAAFLQPDIASDLRFGSTKPRMNTDETRIKKSPSSIRKNPCPSVAPSSASPTP